MADEQYFSISYTEEQKRDHGREVKLFEYSAGSIAEQMNNIIGDALQHPEGKTAIALKRIGVDPHDRELRRQAMERLGFTSENTVFNKGDPDPNQYHKVFVYRDGSQVAVLSGEIVVHERDKSIPTDTGHDVHLRRTHGAVSATGIDWTDPSFLKLLFKPEDKPLAKEIVIPVWGEGKHGLDMDLPHKARLEQDVSLMAKNDVGGKGSGLEEVVAGIQTAVSDYSGGTVLAKPVPTDTQGRKV
jgi:hypothetical protein